MGTDKAKRDATITQKKSTEATGLQPRLFPLLEQGKLEVKSIIASSINTRLRSWIGLVQSLKAGLCPEKSEDLVRCQNAREGILPTDPYKPSPSDIDHH